MLYRAIWLCSQLIPALAILLLLFLALYVPFTHHPWCLPASVPGAGLLPQRLQAADPQIFIIWPLWKMLANLVCIKVMKSRMKIDIIRITLFPKFYVIL